MAATNLGTTLGGKHAVSVAASANGKAHLVYAGADGKIHYRRWSGTKWLDDETLPAPGAKNYHPFVVAVNGSPHVVFGSQLGTTSESSAIFYTVRKARAWSEPVRVSQETFAQLPRIVLDSMGTIHLVYDRFGSGIDEIRYAQNAGGTWSKTEFVGKGYYPDVAADANGNATVLWNDDRSLLQRVRSADGTWTPAEKVGSGKKPQTAALVYDGAGVLHYVWQVRQAGIFSSLSYARRTPDGNLTVAKKIQGPAHKLVFFPRLATDCANRARIVYQGKMTANGSEPNRVYQTVFDGSTWSTPTRLDSPELAATNQVPEIHANGTILIAGWINDHPDQAYADVITIDCGGGTLGVPESGPPKPARKRAKALPKKTKSRAAGKKTVKRSKSKKG